MGKPAGVDRGNRRGWWGWFWGLGRSADRCPWWLLAALGVGDWGPRRLQGHLRASGGISRKLGKFVLTLSGGGMLL